MSLILIKHSRKPISKVMTHQQTLTDIQDFTKAIREN